MKQTSSFRKLMTVSSRDLSTGETLVIVEPVLISNLPGHDHEKSCIVRSPQGLYAH